MNCISKWLLKRRIKNSFQQGNEYDGDIILKAILDALYDIYTEDNYSNRLSILVEWILRNESTFQTHAIQNKDKVFIKMTKAVLDSAVVDAIK